MSEEEVTCPKERLEELCRQSAPCRGYLEKYEECARRVASNPGTEEACTEELFDLTPCVDNCCSWMRFDWSDRIVLTHQARSPGQVISATIGMSPPTEIPTEWALVKLKSVNGGKSQHEGASLISSERGSNYSGVKLRSAPKPTDFPSQSQDMPREDKCQGGTLTSNPVYDSIRAGLKKVTPH